MLQVLLQGNGKKKVLFELKNSKYLGGFNSQGEEQIAGSHARKRQLSGPSVIGGRLGSQDAMKMKRSR